MTESRSTWLLRFENRLTRGCAVAIDRSKKRLPYDDAPTILHQRLSLGPLPIIPLPYLVLMKLDASRLQDVADLGRMLGQATATQIDEVRAVVTKHRPGDLEDLEALIASGRWELGLT